MRFFLLVLIFASLSLEAREPLGFTCVSDPLGIGHKTDRIVLQPIVNKIGLYRFVRLQTQAEGIGLEETLVIEDIPCSVSQVDMMVVNCFRKGTAGLGLHGVTLTTQRVERSFISRSADTSAEIKSTYLEFYISYPINDEETQSANLKLNFNYRSCRLLSEEV